MSKKGGTPSVKGKYFLYNTGTQEFERTKRRPNNQSNTATVLAVAEKCDALNKQNGKNCGPVAELLIEAAKISKESGGKERVPLKKNNIHMCHGISIADIMNTILSALNTRSGFQGTDAKNAVKNFGENIFPGDTQMQEKLSDFFSGIQEAKQNNSIQSLLDSTDTICDLLNNAPSNLMGGNGSTNSSLGSSTDRHAFKVRIKDEHVITEMPEHTYIEKTFRELSKVCGINYDNEKVSNSSGLTKASCVSTDPSSACYDSSAFSTTVRTVAFEMLSDFDQTWEDETNGTHPYENEAFQMLCDSFEALNKSPVTEVCHAQALAEEQWGHFATVAKGQNLIDLKYEYDIDFDNLPRDVKNSLGYEDYYEEEEEEEEEEGDNSETSSASHNSYV
jgi:hypothetical protein